MDINKAHLTAKTDSDLCYTPYYAVNPILEFIPKDKVIWCPFDEDWSAFYNTFIEHGYKVIRSSLVEGQDFFEYEPEEHWDILVSNPPFSKKDQVIARCYSFNKPFALLLPTNSLQGKRVRFDLFKQGIELLCFDGRVCYHTNGNFNNYEKAYPFYS